jgi:phosphoglycerate dehydrogenase-like enzyme
LSNQITIAIAFRIDDESIERIKALDPRIRIIDASQISGRGGEPDAGTKARILAELAGAEIMLGPNRIPIDYFDAAIGLKWFQSINAGIERMDRDGLLKRGFVVTSAAGLASVPIAEYVIGAMVMLAKGLHTAARAQREHRWDFRMTAELAGKTVGIAGLGEIGRETAKRARAFEMRVLASRRTVAAGATDPDCDELVPYSNLERLLSESDFLVMALPLTAETQHMIGAAELAQMKPTASIINIARGEIIDQAALVAALSNGTIASAALDVFDPEPLPAESPFWDMPNVIVTPHISGAVEGYGHKATELFIANLKRYLAGEALVHVANPELGY